MRRSLYTDIELSVGVLEPPTPANLLPDSRASETNPAAYGKTAPSFVQDFRRTLWAHYCGIPLVPAQRTIGKAHNFTVLLQLDRALAIWNPAWGTPTPGISLETRDFALNGETYAQIYPRPLPVADAPFDQSRYDREEPDSRQAC
jgi:hypothetical protein